MSWDEVCESVCPIARSLSVVGDRWTLLILRELSMGSRRFEEIQAQTGMSSFLLSTRLKRLEKDGVIERRLYNERPPRYEYHATAKGKDLDEVLLFLGELEEVACRANAPALRLEPLLLLATHRRTGSQPQGAPP